MVPETPETKLEEFFAFVDATKPKFVIARFFDGVLADYASADSEAEALEIQAQFKQFGGKVDIFAGPKDAGPDPLQVN
jgi:hypothetical protein